MKQEIYDEIKILIDSIIAIRIGYKWGLVDKDYKSLSKVVYDYISVEDNQIWIRYRGYKSYISTEELPLKYDFIYEINESTNGEKWTKISHNDKYGTIDSSGKELIPSKYDTIKDYRGALWVSEKETDNTELYGVYSYRGEFISECAYVDLANPIVRKKVGEQIMFGILDENSREVVACEYDSIVSTINNNSSYDKKADNEVFILSKDEREFLYCVKSGLITVAYNKIKQKDRNSYIMHDTREVKDIYYCYRGNHIDEYVYKPDNGNLLDELLDAYKPKYLDIYHFDNLLVTCNLDECTIESRVLNDLFICKSTTTDKYGLLDGKGYRIPFIYERMYVDDDLGVIIALKDCCFIEVEEKVYVGSFLFDGSGFDTRSRLVLNNANLDIYSKYGIIICQNENYKEFSDRNSNSYKSNILNLICNMKDSYYDSVHHISIYYNESHRKLTSQQEKSVRIVKKNGQFGVVSSFDEIIVPLKYEDIQLYQQTFLIAKKNSEIELYIIYSNGLIARKIENYSFVGKKNNGKFLVSRTFVFNGDKDMDKCDFSDLDIGCNTMGVIDDCGNEIVPCKFSIMDEEIISKNVVEMPREYNIERINYEQNTYIKIHKKNNHREMYNFDRDLISGTCQVMGRFKDNQGDSGLLKVSSHEDYKTGLMNYNGELILPCIYPDLSFDNELYSIGYVIVRTKQSYWERSSIVGLVNINTQKEYAINCDNNPLFTHKNKQGVLKYVTIGTDKYSIVFYCDSGRIFQYEGYKIERLVDDYAILQSLTNETKTFFLTSLSNNEIIPSFKYDAVEKCDNHEYLKVMKNNNWGLYHILSEQEIISCLCYETIRECDNMGYLQVRKNSKWGLYHLPSKQETISCLYYEDLESIWGNIPNFNFEKQLAIIKYNNKYGFIDKNGTVVIECKYDDIKPFKDGYAAVHENHYWGFINETETKIIDKLEDCLGFSDGMAAIKMNGKWGYINTNGKIVIPCRFEKANSFSDGLAPVAFKERWGYIDKYNRTIISFRYQYAFLFSEGIASVSDRGGSGYISKDGYVVDWKHYENDSYNDTDHARDTWDAMTDGMYGDCPGGDVNYDGLGF